VNSKFPISRFDLASRVEYLLRSLDFKQPLLRMTRSSELNCFEQNKIGCTNLDGSVDIAGEWWNKPTSSELDKCVVSLIELLRPQRIQKIYEISAELCGLLLAPAQTVSTTTTSVNICEAPTQRFFSTMKACQKDLSNWTCVYKWWPLFVKAYPHCVDAQVGYCIEQCSKDLSSYTCANKCNSGI
jgi:hypothetical protein